jgi:hypothetical protein
VNGGERRIEVSRKLSTIGVALATLVVSCGDATASLFDESKALEVARAFQEAFKKGDADAVAALCRAPTTFQGRSWATDEAIRANLKKELVRAAHVVGDYDAFEARSRADLEDGRFPRGEEVEKAARAARIEALGVESNGYVVRVYGGAKLGYFLTLNVRDAGTRLAVTRVDL